MKPSEKRLKTEVKALRALIDNTKDPITSLIAYGMECAIRWAVEDTKGWGVPSKDALILADMLRKELECS